ncbi:MAG: outer membrane protein transport protein [Ignavibacteria bacterium]|nr:outer membrane protein transport protein [Ignavibacteria bacterium]
MKKIFSIAPVFLVLTVLCTLSGYAQFPEDILRLSFSGTGVGARSLGLGMAYTGVANDFSAMYWNPAGLGQLQMNEVSFGLSHISYGNTSSFFNNSRSFTNSGTSLNDLGFVYSVPAQHGSFVIALGYGRQADFTTGLSFSGFNPRSSIIQTWAEDGQHYPSDLSNNIAYQLYLANLDTINGRFDSRIKNNVTQSGKVIEGGGLNHVSAAAGIEAAQDLFLGVTLNIVTGSYSYERNYYEEDTRNLYNSAPFDFSLLSVLETVESDLTGFNAKLGLLYKFAPNSRIGLAVKTPSWITVREDYTQQASSDFDNGDHYDYPRGSASTGHNEYDVATPFVFSAGASAGYQALMVAGDLEYTDWTQMEFRNASSRLLAFNTQIKEEFRPTVNIHVGAEYEVLPSVLQLRAGFAYMPSPYEGDPSAFDRKYVTGGLSFSAQNAIIVELGYAHGYWKNYRVNYDATSRTDEDVKTNSLVGTVSYRF